MEPVTKNEKKVFSRNLILFVWFVISNLIAFFLGIEYLKEKLFAHARK